MPQTVFYIIFVNRNAKKDVFVPYAVRKLKMKQYAVRNVGVTLIHIEYR